MLTSWLAHRARHAAVSSAQRRVEKAQILSHPGSISGTARKNSRTKDLIKSLRPGDIAVIAHKDVDAIAAQSLVESRVAAVVNAEWSTSGRYPNRGPAILAASRIPLFHLPDPSLFDRVVDGQTVLIESDCRLIQNDVVIGTLDYWDSERIALETSDSRRNLAAELEKFTENTLAYVREEKSLLLEPVNVPPLEGVRPITGKHVVVVVRGEGYKEDLRSISGYLADVRPVLIGVDGGADALLEFGFRPDIILGDMDSVSDRALRSGAKLVVHAYTTSKGAPGLDRVERLGLASELFPIAGTSEDAALLLADEKKAELIVAVGTHSNLESFLDKGRAGMSSTFLVRLKVGSRLVDARGVSQLHQHGVGFWELAALVLSAVFVLVVLVTQTPFGHAIIDSIRLWWRVYIR